MYGAKTQKSLSVYSINVILWLRVLTALLSPERWENLPEIAKNMPGVWGHVMTFIGGARGCIGYRFALIEFVLSLPSYRCSN